MLDEMEKRLRYIKKKREKNTLFPEELKEIQNLKKFIDLHIQPCVYFLCKDDKVIYVGQTVNLYVRLDYHRKHKDFDSVFFIEVNKRDLLKVESYYAKRLTPEGHPLLSTSKKTFSDRAANQWVKSLITKIKQEEEEAAKKASVVWSV